MPKRSSAPDKAVAGRFRDRIREYRRVRCGDIEPHPMNPRLHSGKQLGAVSGLLVEVGKCAPLIAFPADGKGPAGDFARLMYIDGHGRRQIDPDEVWPIAVTDLTRAEADKMVISGDATAAMAEYDPVKVDALLRDVDTGCAELQEMLSELWEEAKSPTDESVEGEEPQETEVPAMYEVVIGCADEVDQKQMYERLTQEGRKCRLLTV